MAKKIVFGLTILFVLVANLEVDAQLNDELFAELMKVVPVEKTKQIDWYPDLLSAQKVALQQKKPIFIWSMDGHPLGCT